MTAMAPQMTLGAAELARRTGGSWIGATPDLNVTGIEIDSRSCGAGSLFAALPGQHADGHGFVAAAARNGAKVILGGGGTSEIFNLFCPDDLKHVHVSSGGGVLLGLMAGKTPPGFRALSDNQAPEVGLCR